MRKKLALIRLSPDFHFLSLGNKFLSEIRVSNGDDLLSTLPSSSALQIHDAVLSNQIIDVGSGSGDYAARGHTWTNAALERAVLVLHCGGATDEALATLRQVCAQHEV